MVAKISIPKPLEYLTNSFAKISGFLESKIAFLKSKAVFAIESEASSAMDGSESVM